VAQFIYKLVAFPVTQIYSTEAENAFKLEANIYPEIKKVQNFQSGGSDNPKQTNF